MLTFYERVTLVPYIAAFLLSAIASVPRAIFRGKDGAPHFRLRLLFRVFNAQLAWLSPRQVQAISPGTASNFESFRKKATVPTSRIKLKDGTDAFWIGKPDARVVLLYFHGGGFALPAAEDYFTFQGELIGEAERKSISLSSFFVRYDLTPDAHYPRQVDQVLEAYNYLLENGRSPLQIMVAGDSAGGNLTLSLLSSIAHPRKDSVAPKSSEPVRAAALLSPWVTFDQSAASLKDNESKDLLRRSALKTWSHAYLGNAPTDPYNTPLSAPEGWWKDIKSQKTLLVSGKDEGFIDDIDTFAEVLKKAGNNIEYQAFVDEAHVAMYLHGLAGVAHPPSRRLVIDWLLDQAA